MSGASIAEHAAVSRATMPGSVRRRLAELRDKLAQGQGAEVWRTRPIGVRVALIMMALESDGSDLREQAAQPWGAFTPDQRAALGATARTLRDALHPAGYLR